MSSTHLIQACQCNDLPYVQALLDSGAEVEEVDSDQRTALCVAALYNSDSEIAQMLLDRGANINHTDKSGSSPLCLAAWKDNTALAKLFIEHGAKVNLSNMYGDTPLFMAAVINSTEIAQVLLQHGADVDHTNQDGNTALCLATIYKNPEVAQILVHHGADINHTNVAKCTPTILAAKRKSKAVLSLLIQTGAHLDCQDTDGRTALMLACQDWGMDCVELLFDAGADTALRDAKGLTLLHYVLKSHSGSLVFDRGDLISLLLSKAVALEGDFHLLILYNFPWRPGQLAELRPKLLPSLESFSNEDILPSGMRLLKDQALTPLCCALLADSFGLARFFVSNLFLHAHDLRIQSHIRGNIHFSPFFNQDAARRDEFLNCLFSQPWTLRSLCFVQVSTCLGFGPCRKERIERSGLPKSVQRRLQFDTAEWRTESALWSGLRFE